MSECNKYIIFIGYHLGRVLGGFCPQPECHIKACQAVGDKCRAPRPTDWTLSDDKLSALCWPIMASSSLLASKVGPTRATVYSQVVAFLGRSLGCLRGTSERSIKHRGLIASFLVALLSLLE